MAVIFIPRLMDDAQLNPQNKNAQGILSRWTKHGVWCRTITYGLASKCVTTNPSVDVHSLWRGRLWLIDLFRQYFKHTDLLFYPGGMPIELRAMQLRQRLMKGVPIVVTVEGLIGNAEREKEYTEWAEHPVFCQHVDDKGNERWDKIFRMATHIIAISPFLAEMTRKRYGDKVSVLPLGVDDSVFHSNSRKASQKVRVISAGRVDAHKRPELMLDVAVANPGANFKWFGEGALREPLLRRAAKQEITNIQFPGALAPAKLAHEMRNADIFMMPSKSEGVPKVTQEAAACGLAQVIFGFYEAPSVTNGENGFVVWDDQQFVDRIRQLIDDRQLTASMGVAGAARAKDWDWDIVAKQWQDRICEFLPIKR
jgi:glycosyltransferase involved in cell wall biosynthesis